ncbi:hypothetical protein Kpho01_25090 [Kitasatospora phosalacinea]|uniref:Uncharacterized protein n=1 Tax=Kitasatospora phosalacinea TaxID=2065 RepID=A0A9W6PGI4_9ACTN|nr:hypothetical protein Kpho01_25090 [Kitasatospora phosalacinea]
MQDDDHAAPGGGTFPGDPQHEFLVVQAERGGGVVERQRRGVPGEDPGQGDPGAFAAAPPAPPSRAARNRVGPVRKLRTGPTARPAEAQRPPASTASSRRRVK